jgi:putative hydrolases of HD superfamily
MNPHDFTSFAKQIGTLKKLKRAGWVREEIKDPESVADHSFRTAIFAMTLAPFLKVDQLKFIKMALIHDTAESTLGDVIVERGAKIDTELLKEKEEKERDIIKNLFSMFGGEYLKLFEEFIKRETIESKLLWQIDKLERTIQAAEYREEQKKALQEFFDGGKIFITDPLLQKILNDIL